MRERLAERKAHLVPVEGAPEQDRHQLDRGLRDVAGGDHLVAARAVMRGKAVDPRVQPEERQVVRRQDERLGRHRFAQLAQATTDSGRADRRPARAPGR